MLSIRAILSAFLLTSTIGCYSTYKSDTGFDEGEEETVADDTGNNNTGDNYDIDTWLEIRTGYCFVQRSTDFGANWSDVETHNVAGDHEKVLVTGEPGEMMHIFCDADQVPQYNYPQVEFDPNSCPKVYCNPWGDTNREFGEDEDCGDNLEAYVYPEAQWYGDGLSDEECGPWNLDL